MNDTDTPPCGCCAGETRETPTLIWNRPGLSSIAYRAGNHATFRASMLSALSDPGFPALAPLTTRDDSDFSIAILDAFAVSADILTFYQERLANESYLRTAVQQRSVFELARLVGYRPSPGVSASAPLAFALNDALGAPDPVLVSAGTRVQSIPAPGQQPAVFETDAPLTARIAHNALPPETTRPVDWAGITTWLWLTGTATGLKPGDAILFVDADRLSPGHAACQLWEMRAVTSVSPDAQNGRTRVDFDQTLFTTFRQGARNVQCYALRKRASLFGMNAPDPHTLPSTLTIPHRGADDWNFVHDLKHVDLDTLYPEIAPGDAPAAEFAAEPQRLAWLVLSRGRSHRPIRKLYRIVAAADRAPLRYVLSGKATGLSLDTDDFLAQFVAATREVTAFVQTEPLAIAEQPIMAPVDGFALGPGMLTPVAGNSVTVLGGGMLAVGQAVAVIGKRARLQFGGDPNSAELLGPDGRTKIQFASGDVFLVDAYPPAPATGSAAVWSVRTPKGIAGTLRAAIGAVALLPADKADVEVSEAALIAGVDARAARTTLTFKEKLSNIYDRATMRINANVVTATHGETVKEILGGADSSVANQSFTLKQSPLTYLSAAQGQGAKSTLQVWVNDLRWQEAPSLLDSGPRDRVFVTRRKDAGMIVQFGDGRKGARPATGLTNVRADYRKGLGTAGMVVAGQLSQAIDRPAGLKSVSNPAPASGGADPDTPDFARRSAPLHVLTLERVVSLRDYEDYATAFAGIAKALATWTWFGRTRGVVVTVAGQGGALLDPNGETIANLATTLRTAGNPYVPVAVLPYRPVLFQVGGLVRIDEQNYDPVKVLTSVRAALGDAFGFGARALGQGVAQSEVISACQRVAGVQALRLTSFTREDAAADLPPFLTAASPRTGERGTVQGAELVLIDMLSLSLLERWP